MSMHTLMEEIARITPEGGDWCSVEKAQTLAAIILGHRCRRVVEIGVWHGGSLIPMALAMKYLGAGHAIGIDAWSTDASVVGQTGDDEAWWKTVDHDAAYGVFMARVAKHELEPYCRVMRQHSSDVQSVAIETMFPIDLLHVDGNHGPQAVDDVMRFSPSVPVGGYLVLDDVNWSGGHVTQALTRATNLGFVTQYELGTGVVMQRMRPAVQFDFGGGV